MAIIIIIIIIIIKIGCSHQLHCLGKYKNYTGVCFD